MLWENIRTPSVFLSDNRLLSHIEIKQEKSHDGKAQVRESDKIFFTDYESDSFQ